MIEQVKRWLEEQGFPLEMQTASEFRKAGFEVTQANLYNDPETGKSREIDVFAAFKDHLGVTKIAFVVECKSSKKPWLLLSDPEVLTGYHRVHSFAVSNAHAFKAMAGDPVFDSLMGHCPWFRKDQLTGYSLRTAFSEKDVAFEAAMSAAKASLAYVKGAREYQQRVVFPLIVVASPLIRCYLDDQGQIKAEEISQGEVFFKCDLENPWSCIRVVTLPALPKFVREAREVATFLRTQLLDSEAKLWETQFSEPYPFHRGEDRSQEGESADPRETDEA